MIVDLWFPIVGKTLPSDHGYALYSALCARVPAMHGAAWWGLHTVRGARGTPGVIELPTSSRLGLRLPTERIGEVMPLVGDTLEAGGHRIRLGIPLTAPLRPAAAVSARMVTIRGFTEPEALLAAARRQLDVIGLAGDDCQLGARKILTVGGQRIVGYALRVAGLDATSSIRLQEQGLGGRRHFGCGLFRPSRSAIGPDTRPARDQ